jgi:eukaryotic-like serine/threonine-protein kinase
MRSADGREPAAPGSELSGRGRALASALAGGRAGDLGDLEARGRSATLAASISAKIGATEARLGRFSNLRHIGGGALGVVYAAYDPELGAEVAIKLLSRRSDDAKLRLWREAVALATIEHPNVLSVYEVGWLLDTAYIATELAPLGTLGDWLETPRPLIAVIDRFSQAARGLAAVHGLGLVHRDVKPANVFIGADGRVLIGDFGLAARVGAKGEAAIGGDTRADLTDGFAVGTAGYAAPEQWAGHPVDARADQYALSMALARAIYGRCVSAAEVRDVRLPASRTGEPVPAALLALIRRGLSEAPADRHRSVDDFATILEGVGDDLLARQARRVFGWQLVVILVVLSLACALAAVGRW